MNIYFIRFVAYFGLKFISAVPNHRFIVLQNFTGIYSSNLVNRICKFKVNYKRIKSRDLCIVKLAKDYKFYNYREVRI